MQRYTDNWAILSAKYGFLMPEDIIPETYDVTFDRETDPYISIEALKDQCNTKKFNHFHQLLVICNDRYVSRVEACFDGPHVNIEVPFKHLEDDGQGALLLNNSLQAKVACIYPQSLVGR